MKRGTEFGSRCSDHWYWWNILYNTFDWDVDLETSEKNLCYDESGTERKSEENEMEVSNFCIHHLYCVTNIHEYVRIPVHNICRAYNQSGADQQLLGYYHYRNWCFTYSHTAT